jgi:hypothetical protein
VTVAVAFSPVIFRSSISVLRVEFFGTCSLQSSMPSVPLRPVAFWMKLVV